MPEKFCRYLRNGIKMVDGSTTEAAIPNFLKIYQETPNSNAVSGKSPANFMFARKINIFDKLVPNTKKTKK